MYKDYWGLTEYPFENLPNPAYMYRSPMHEEAITRLVYAINNRKGAAMLTGEIGCGKTTVSRLLVEQLAARNYQVALIENPSLGPNDFFREILYQFGVSTPNGSRPEMIQLLNDLLYHNLKEGRNSVIIVDEAQLIRNKLTFEELRLLLNFQLNDRSLLTIILIGQPELGRKIKQIPQLDQRIGIRYHLRPLDVPETVRFVLFRLRKAGSKRNMFNNEAFWRVHSCSNGIPRKINNICDLSLLIGCGESAKFINPEIVDKSAHDTIWESSAMVRITDILNQSGGASEEKGRVSLPSAVPAARKDQRKVDLPAVRHGLAEFNSKIPHWLEPDKTINLYRSINTLLPDARQKVIQFIGSAEGEGTSSIARAFALLAVTQFGKSVLLLDADALNPSQAAFFNVSPEYSFEDVLREDKDVHDAIYPVNSQSLFIGSLSSSASSITQIVDFLGKDTFCEKLQDFDFILFDSPPATLSPEGLALARVVDGVVFVLEAEKTRGPVAESVMEKIKQNGGNVLGVVVNKRRHRIPGFVYERL